MKAVLVALAVLAASGCALTSKSEALDIRYYTPDVRTVAGASGAEGRGAELRLGRITAGDGLHERIAYSDGTHEVGYYDDRRWTERPDFYVRRALTRALFERRGLRHVFSGDAPTLEVDVISFEEIKTKARHAVRIELTLRLSNDHEVLLETQRTVERPVIEDKRFEAVAAAMAAALDDVSDQVALNVATSLAQHPAPAAAQSSNP